MKGSVPSDARRRRGTVSGVVRPRNDPRQYDDLVDHWEDPGAGFAALHWLARVRGALVPGPITAGDHRPVLVDVGCGGGLLAPYVHGYRHVGIDLMASGLGRARRNGVTPVVADASQLPLRPEAADVVVAGEIFEHVVDLDGVVSEVARILRPGGIVVFDTINDTWWARLSLVTVAERLPGGPPPRIHDPALFVRPQRLATLFERHGITIRCRGLRPSALDYVRFLVRRHHLVRMLPIRSLAAVYQGIGRKPQDGRA